MRFFHSKDDVTPKRMRNRKYVFAVSTLAAFLLIVAFIEPQARTAVSQATVTIYEELGAQGSNPLAERIKSISFLRKVGERYGMTTGAAADPANALVDDWATNTRDRLQMMEQTSAAANAVDLVLQYNGRDAEQSVLVMESLLATLTQMTAPVGSAVPSQKAQLSLRAAEQRCEQAREDLDLLLAEKLAALREEHIRIEGERQFPVSPPSASGSESDDTYSLPAAMESANLRFGRDDPGVVDQHDVKQDWLSDQKLIDEQNQRLRNPEYDAFVRALVGSQAERQELLTRFPAEHASVRRVEIEIRDLELLASHTEQYLRNNEPADQLVSLSRNLELLKVEDLLANFDESSAIESIRQSESYQSLHDRLIQSQHDLQNLQQSRADQIEVPAELQRVFVSAPPEMVSPDLAGLSWPKLLTVVAISSLLGFVVSRLGDSTSLPDDFYSIEDVRHSLKIPVFGHLEMEGKPEIPQPERIASVRFWHVGVRLAELLAMLLVGALVFALITRPSLWGALFQSPLMTYMDALQELRGQVPLPYLFK